MKTLLSISAKANPTADERPQRMQEIDARWRRWVWSLFITVVLSFFLGFWTCSLVANHIILDIGRQIGEVAK